jgi:hypothetical protein
MHKKIMMLFLIGIIYPTLTNAQLVARYKVSYQVEEQTYNFPETGEMRKLEPIMLQDVYKKDNVEKIVYSTNDIKTTVTHLVKDNRIKPWMDDISKTVVDKNYTWLYNSSNVLIEKISTIDDYKNYYNGIKNYLTDNSEDIIPDFPVFNPVDTPTWLSNGYTITYGPNDEVRIEDASHTIIIDPLNLTYSYEVKSSFGTESYLYRKFKVNNLGQTVPSIETEMTKGTTSTGVCYKKLTKKIYSGYKTTYYNPKLGDIADEPILPSCTIYPNPVVDECTVEFSYLPDITLDVFIIDITGRIWFEKNLDPQYLYQFDLEFLPQGAYLIKLKDATKNCSFTFIKN